ncbi:pectinesterase-like isoform X2 [Lolium rigidum]|uniref:pectinesterase-like isoform X2 n=1 Tax=Lolium rigidum TaxID=89674 RepID=UPI001F5D4D38|nr:pectinesterase-like isoform X2 [Lolium rigidum]
MSPSLYDKRRHLFVLLSLLTLTLAAGLSTADAAAATVSFYPSPEAAAAAHCDGTLYPDLCLSTLATIPSLHKKPLRVVIGATCNRTETEVTDMSANCSSYLQESSLTARDRLAVSDCIELLDDTMDDLRATTSDLEQRLSTASRPMMHEVMTAPASGIKADAVVAKDGSGAYTTVSAAVAAAPTNSKTRYVIYIKAGTYMENVEVGKKHKNLMFVGDGIGKTVIKASLNVVDGSTTFRSATVAVVGNNFLARDLTIENSAGPSKHQAVALRVGADLAAFYRCSFVGYQDTLYVHSLRQFFRECDIYGTIDFVFGNSAVVLQSCNLYARRPMASQSNVYTAQGRTDPNQNTGISIQKCKVAAASDLAAVQSSFRTYLGRPWKQYSRTVYLQSDLGSVVDPAGWLAWDGTFALDTLYYGEYQNTGAGASTSNRVKWKGYRVISSSSEASTFTVGSFIDGDVWLAGTSIPFSTGF